MKYRSVGDRKISSLLAILIIVAFGSIATLSIIRTIYSINFAYLYQSAAVGD